VLLRLQAFIRTYDLFPPTNDIPIVFGNKSGQIIAAVKESNWKPMSVFDPSGQPKLYFETRQ
jgi:hypothetical protein